MMSLVEEVGDHKVIWAFSRRSYSAKSIPYTYLVYSLGVQVENMDNSFWSFVAENKISAVVVQWAKIWQLKI